MYFIRALDLYGNEALSPQGGKWAPYEVEVYGDALYLVVFSLQAAGLCLIVWFGLKIKKLKDHETR